RFLLCAAFLLASSCIKRVAPDPGADRAAYAAVPIAFGQREAVPEGSEVVWDFGDGTQATGMQVTHAFPRAGVYTIVETIRDKGAGFFTVPQDPEALVFAVGTLDDAKALAAARRLLSSPRGVGRFGAGPFQLSDAKLPDGTPVVLGQSAAGDKVAVVQRYGY